MRAAQGPEHRPPALLQDPSATVSGFEERIIAMVIAGKNATDALYYITVNGSTEVLSEEAVFRLIDTLITLTGAEDFDASIAPGTATKQ